MSVSQPDVDEIRILSASDDPGYEIPSRRLGRVVTAMPDFIGADMGSTDLGRYYLSSGEMAAPKAVYNVVTEWICGVLIEIAW